MSKCVIIGAGQAGRRAAESLRERSPDARICIIGGEAHLPYDRPSLSKQALLSEKNERHVFIRDADFYASARIEVRTGVRAASIDRSAKTVALEDGTQITYDRLLLATGSRVRTLDGGPVHYLRTLDDARALRAKLTPGARVAIVGGGFVGLEVAASASALGCAVTLMEPSERVLKRSMPPLVSEYVARLHARNGVDLQMHRKVLEVREHDGVLVVETSAGSFTADLVVAGIGVVPETELAQQADITVDDGIVVDEHCRTSDPDIFAAGEVTRHFVPFLGRAARVESWQVAEKQPAVAAANMLGAPETYSEVPWLWSDQFDCNIQTLGYFDSAHRIIVRGDVAGPAMTVLGVDEAGNLRAATTVNNGRDMAALTRLTRGGPLDLTKLADASVPLRSLIRR
ncbi:NAD(P)/FAD-dependent oxidoreductase [Paraburkholderia gardini]|uniref:Anthranilate 1,2-dioxygenase system ferredoxin--NAD(+) reductase component n=1 Tax=Paraburkholderia gardini TaxID=2823469 RepID=A0ABN7QQK0_9BURK|nr:FAD-dependent oxidoreductase [Paraburkholderia gardini]CAG4909550.1 Anthranilate 1,2-dioxygenase system ferredoxin--NAD(+) reductase component [Paraburkholderia gardini]